MRTLIVCKSVSHGNTAKIAAAMGSVLDADVVAPGDIEPDRVVEYDLVGFGSGIYGGSFHPALRGFVATLPQTKRAHAFVFATCGFGRIIERPWQPTVKRMLAARGYHVLGTFCCRGYDTWLPLRLVGGLNKGHPDDRDVQRAIDFARSCDVRLSSAV